MHLMFKRHSLSLSKYSFHMKLIPQYVSAVKHAVTPKEIDLKVSPHWFPFLFHFCYLYQKSQTAMYHHVSALPSPYM